jgi:3-deoxy-D-arabino-heptulosonate 7-phosphate (DAHP) synthase class II
VRVRESRPRGNLSSGTRAKRGNKVHQQSHAVGALKKSTAHLTSATHTGIFGGVTSWRDHHVHLEPRWKRSQQLHSNAQTNEGSHRAVGNCRREENLHQTVLIIAANTLLLGHIQLLQCERVLWIVDGSNEVYERGSGKTQIKIRTHTQGLIIDTHTQTYTP